MCCMWWRKLFLLAWLVVVFFLRRPSVKLHRIRTGVRRDNVEKSMFFDAFDLILLVVDELVDGGCVSKHCPF